MYLIYLGSRSHSSLQKKSGSSSAVSFITPRTGSHSACSTPGSGMGHQLGFHSSAIVCKFFSWYVIVD